MLGLIRQLAKLITLAKNFPQLLALIPRLFTLPSTIAEIQAAPQLAKIDDQNFLLGETLDESRDSKIEQVNVDDTLTPNQKSIRINDINSRYNSRKSTLLNSDATAAAKLNATDDYKSKIEPSIQSALAPLGMAVGIPTGINYLSKLLGGGELDGFENVVGAGSAEAAFQSDMAALGDPSEFGFPIGTLSETLPTTLRLRSAEENPTLTDFGGTVQPIIINVFEPQRGDLAKTGFVSMLAPAPKFFIYIQDYGNVPLDNRNIFNVSIDDTGVAIIGIDTIPEVPFNTDIVINISANKRIIRVFGISVREEIVRAQNIVRIPVQLV